MKSIVQIAAIFVFLCLIGACTKPQVDSKLLGTWKPRGAGSSDITTVSADHTWKSSHANGEVSTSGTWIVKGNQVFLTISGSTPPHPVIFDLQQVDASRIVMTHKNEKTGEISTIEMARE
jgi:hypothetical protein